MAEEPSAAELFENFSVYAPYLVLYLQYVHSAKLFSLSVQFPSETYRRLLSIEVETKESMEICEQNVSSLANISSPKGR